MNVYYDDKNGRFTDPFPEAKRKPIQPGLSPMGIPCFELSGAYMRAKEVVAKAYTNYLARFEARIVEALIQKCGSMPNLDTLKLHGKIVIDFEDGRHFYWKGEELVTLKPFHLKLVYEPACHHGDA